MRDDSAILSSNENFNTSHVKVNHYMLILASSPFQISIHPMLKLIWNHRRYYAKNDYFNTSHVKVNLQRAVLIILFWHNFNTSHVKVNLQTLRFRWRSSRISIHPMLKLICSQILCNIHCEQISIHPMLKLIKSNGTFQFKNSNFNTSHVKVNLWIGAEKKMTRLFQYIPC